MIKNPFAEPKQVTLNNHIRNKAEEFYKAALILFENSAFKVEAYPTPFIILASLSIELYFKSLSSEQKYYDVIQHGSAFTATVTSHPNIECHSYTQLWSEIPAKIQKIFNDSFKQDDLRNRYSQFNKLLKKYNNIFTNERYSFESKEREIVDVNEFHSFLIFVNETISKIILLINNRTIV